eukprot:g3832.t1
MVSNSATHRGGAILSFNENNITIIQSRLNGNNAVEYSGGAIYSEEQNKITVIQSRLNGNRASIYGGAIYSEVQNKITVIQSRLNDNKAVESGGAIYCHDQNNISVIQSRLNGNNAQKGGAIYVQGDSIVIVSFTLLHRNNATRGGAIYINRNIQLTISKSNCTKNNASTGGCLYGDRSALNFEGYECIENFSNKSGGCLYLEACNINLRSNNYFFSNKAKNGGGIYATSRAFLHLNQTYFSSNSAKKGGGMALIDDSTLFCLSCTFENNTANQGGGLYIASNAMEILIAQLTNSAFRNNNASSYGGGILVKTFGIRNLDCTEIKSPCDRVVLFGVIFEKNIARFSSIIMATTPENILVSCSEDFSMAQSLITRESIKTAIANNTLNILDNEELCSSWVIGWHLNDDPEVAIGTFGHTLNLTTISIDDSSIKVNDSRGFELDAMRSAKGSLSITIIAFDAFGKYPTPPLIDKDTLELSYSFGNIRKFYTFSHDNLTCIIYPIPKNVYLLNYTIEILPKEEDILENTTLMIHIDKCEINEDLANDKNTCQECRDGSYNFHPLEIGGCTPCSENANCSGRYIVPKEGYWHKGPCHDKVKECIVDDACNTPNRIEALEQITLNETSCDINETTLKKYDNTQFSNENSQGVASNQGSVTIEDGNIASPLIAPEEQASNSNTLEVQASNSNVPEVQVSTPNAPEIQENNSNGQMEQESSLNVQEDQECNANTPQIQESNSNASNQEEGDDVESVKQKVLEAWKILLNFLQVTSVAALMKIQWTKVVLNLFHKLQFISAATLNAISTPLDCILSSTSHTTRAIRRVLFSLLVPTTVVALLTIHWIIRLIGLHQGERLYFAKRFTLTIITVTYITYFDLTQAAVRVFNCISIHDDIDFNSNLTTKSWIADTSIECYKGMHLVLVGIALVLLTSVSIGYPLFCSYALFMKQDEVHRQRSWANETISFLCGPYKSRFIYWECITMLKKAFLSIIIVFSYSLGNYAQGVLISLVFVIFLYIHLVCLPYKEEYNNLNYYESGSLLSSCLTYALIQFLNVETYSELSRGFISASLIIVNVGYTCIMLRKIIKDLSSLLRALLKSEEIENLEDKNFFCLLILYFRTRRLHPSTS